MSSWAAPFRARPAAGERGRQLAFGAVAIGRFSSLPLTYLGGLVVGDRVGGGGDPGGRCGVGHPPRKEGHPVKLGVYNAILHDRPLPEALKVIADLGLTGIEIFALHQGLFFGLFFIAGGGPPPF